MDRPPGGWSDLVTKDHLDAKLDAVRADMSAFRSELEADMATFRSELKADMASLSASVDRRLRAQTWITTSVLIAGLTLAFTAGRFA